MEFGKKLLDLTLEYKASVDARDPQWDRVAPGGTPVGREPADIAADYENVILNLLAPDVANSHPSEFN